MKQLVLNRLVRPLLILVMSERVIRTFSALFLSIIEDVSRSRAARLPRSLTHLGPPYKLHVGCGGNLKEGWVNIDLASSSDLTMDVRYGMPFF